MDNQNRNNAEEYSDDDYMSNFRNEISQHFVRNNKSQLNNNSKAELLNHFNVKQSIIKRIVSVKIPAYYAAAAVLLFFGYMLTKTENITIKTNYIVKKDTVLVEKVVPQIITKKVIKYRNIPIEQAQFKINTNYNDTSDLSYIAENPIAKNTINNLKNNIQFTSNAKKGFSVTDDSISKLLENIKYY